MGQNRLQPRQPPVSDLLTSLAGITTLVFYGYALKLLWPASEIGAQAAETSESSARWVVLLALLAHAYSTHQILFEENTVRLSLLYVANVVSLIMTVVVLIAAWRLPVARLFLLTVPLGMLAVALSLFVDPGFTTSQALSMPLLSHIVISLAAYSALMLAACQSILLAILDKRLKTPGRQTSQWLPPLETMEQLLVAMLWIGLTLLTASIASGFLFLEDMFVQNVAHHIIITSLSWIVYALFLGGRYVLGWRGLTAVRWTLVAFALLVIGYLGSKFVLEYILQR